MRSESYYASYYSCRNGRWIKLEIWDTAGQERYRSITPAMYNRAEGFVVMFDLTNRQSYYNCQQW